MHRRVGGKGHIDDRTRSIVFQTHDRIISCTACMLSACVGLAWGSGEVTRAREKVEEVMGRRQTGFKNQVCSVPSIFEDGLLSVKAAIDMRPGDSNSRRASIKRQSLR